MALSRAVSALRVLVGVALGLAVVEAALRVPPARDLVLDRYRFHFIDGVEDALLGQRRLSDPVIEYRQRPHWRGEFVYPHGRVPYRTNRDGFRFDDLPYAKPAGVTRFAFYGNSVLLSKEIRAEDTLPVRVAAELTARGLPAEGLNFALEDTTLPHWLLTHLHFGARYHPDVAVVLDANAWAEPRLFERDPATGQQRLVRALPGATQPAWRGWLQAAYVRSRLMAAQHAVRDHLAGQSPVDALVCNWPQSPHPTPAEEFARDPQALAMADAEVGRYVAALRAFTAEARAGGVREVVVVWIRSPITWRKPGRDEHVFAAIERALQARPIAGMRLIDARPLLAGRSDDAWYLPRLNHFHEAGARELAAWLAPQLVRPAVAELAP
jgi:hypothetical protein